MNIHDIERAAFEEAYAQAGPKDLTAADIRGHRRGEGYANKYPILQGAWIGWQLSQAAIDHAQRTEEDGE